MSEIFDVEAWRQVMMTSMAQLGGTIAAFLPSLVATVVILLLGWLLSKGVELVAARALQRFGLDRA
jgi:hypothetical protein